jgi:hypothetical protein
MPNRMNVQRDESRDTQLDTIRDLMLAAGHRGAWLTLGEIAGLTEIGEASISAQLRHLRKWRYGCHLVEKRRRPLHSVAECEEGQRRARNKRAGGEVAVWEYRVLPSAGCGVTGRLPEAFSGCIGQASEEVGDAEACD